MEHAQVRNWLGIIAATATSLLITVGFGLSVKQLYMSLDDIRSLSSVYGKALSLDGDLQYQIQDSRRWFLQVLIPMDDPGQRLENIDDVRKADLQVSLLAATEIYLTHDPDQLKKFYEDWQAYTDIRDTMIAMSLQGRFPEVLRLDARRAHRILSSLPTIYVMRKRSSQASRSESPKRRGVRCVVRASKLLVCF